MAYLDISPTIAALRARPDEFDLVRGWLRHTPSNHRFKVDPRGDVQLEAGCDCVMLSVSRQQGRELHATFQEWRQGYWRAVEINRQFAAHFRPPGLLRRLWRALKARPPAFEQPAYAPPAASAVLPDEAPDFAAWLGTAPAAAEGARREPVPA
ncbi:MAG: hypothetical protein U1E53_15000 [Dongiaceae bacterium]